jgi:molybdopterin/thiamine biosynthesis adenylyltransferase
MVLFYPEESGLRTGGGLGAAAYLIKPDKKRGQFATVPITTQRYSPETLAQRLPLFEGMQQAKVVVCGLGSLGSPIAVELSRAGVGDLRLMDDDSIDAGTTVRYALGLNYAGVSKVDALTDYIHKNYPFTRVTPVNIRLGATQGLNLPAQLHVISSDVDHLGKVHDCLDGADLIIDASAEDRVNSYLSTEAYRLGTPYITLAGTYGMWGGEVLRVRPGQCWCCFKWSQVDKAKGSIPDPPQDPNAKVQPNGCRAVTFQGAGFDGGEISLMATRFAISTLAEKYAPGAYPEIAEDGAILSIRDEVGNFKFAHWEPFKLVKHENCRMSCRFDL